MDISPSNNEYSADNQQERLKIANWIVGFTDGEGCFSISIFKNKTSKTGYQVMPEFVITQGESSLQSLELIREFFNCGKIFINRRYDNHHEHLYRYCVRPIDDLRKVIIPFFDQNPLRTSKRKNFERFRVVVRLMEVGMHLSEDGIKTLRKISRS